MVALKPTNFHPSGASTTPKQERRGGIETHSLLLALFARELKQERRGGIET